MNRLDLFSIRMNTVRIRSDKYVGHIHIDMLNAQELDVHNYGFDGHTQLPNMIGGFFVMFEDS